MERFVFRHKVRNVECPTVHIAMVATGDMGSRELYTTLKSVFIHRSTPLHFHFLTDERGRTILQTMLSTWLLPGVSHDYYDIQQALQSATVPNSLLHCPRTLSLHLNLHFILPRNIQHVIVIEPTSVVTVDLAGLWAVSVLREDDAISLCSGCVTYCQEEPGEWVSRWGTVGLNLTSVNVEDVVGETAGQVGDCSPSGSGATVDEAVMMVLGIDHLRPKEGEKDACKSVKEYDGNLLRHREIVKCSLKPRISPAPSKKDPCKLFAWERETIKHELPFIMSHTYTPTDQYDISLVNHIDFNRLNLLKRSFTNWYGPASIGIQVDESQVQEVVDYILNSELLRSRTNISYHLQFRIGPSYPINQLRELGHKFATTPYVFYGDVDFVPSPDMYQVMRQNLREIGGLTKTAVVIPAFETDNQSLHLPRSKAEMVQLLGRDVVRPFHVNVFAQGHQQTNYTKWQVATEPYYVSWGYLYEPYTLLPAASIPFDTQFVARFRNKVCHNAELHMAGYKFLVLSDAFIIHMPHEKNNQNMDALKKCDKSWYTSWVREKKKQHHYKGTDVPEVYFPS